MFDQDHIGSKEAQPAYRKHLTAFNSVVNVLEQQCFTRSIRDRRILQPHYQHMRYMTTPSYNRSNPADPICSHFLLHGYNRLQKAPVHAGCWSSDGRRLVLGTQLGEFNLWEGDTFKFEKLVTTHQHPIRAMAWSMNGQMLLSGDHEGMIKYFNASMTNVKNIPDAHESAVRGLSFAPSESKYVSCSDDSSVKVWDWEKGVPDVVYSDNEHLSDVKCAEWHPFRSLIATGSKDNTVKLWDPRESRSLSTLHGHKNTVLCASWNSSGTLLATGSRDHLIKIYDIRTMTEYAVLRGHQKEVCSLKWHPIQESLLLSGGFNGTLIYWVMGYSGPHTIISNAHNYSVNVLAWHPLGHCVASCANGFLLFSLLWNPKSFGAESHQDASLALKITYGPSKNTTAQEKIEEKVAAVERKSNATERGSKQSEQMRSAPAVNPGSSSRDVRGDNRADTATKSRDELDREENSRKRSRFS